MSMQALGPPKGPWVTLDGQWHPPLPIPAVSASEDLAAPPPHALPSPF